MEDKGYQSPIELFTTPIEMISNNCEAQSEKFVYEAIQKIGINIDKDELIKALRYDRQQYEAGYAAGKASVLQHGHWESSGFPEYPYRCSHCGNLTKENVERSYCGSCGAAMDE